MHLTIPLYELIASWLLMCVPLTLVIAKIEVLTWLEAANQTKYIYVALLILMYARAFDWNGVFPYWYTMG